MDVAGLVMPVRVGADNRLMTGKLLPAEPPAKLLRLIYGQPVVRAVPWVKADDVMMAFDILALLIHAIAEVGAHTGNCKIFLAAVQRGNTVILSRHKPPVCVQRGLHGKLVMCKGQVFFSVAVVGVFRADMFERCQRLHLPFPALQTSKQLVVDRGNRDNRTDTCALNGSADKLGLPDVLGTRFTPAIYRVCSSDCRSHHEFSDTP